MDTLPLVFIDEVFHAHIDKTKRMFGPKPCRGGGLERPAEMQASEAATSPRVALGLRFRCTFLEALSLMLLQSTHTFKGRNPFKRAFVCWAKGSMIIKLLCVPLCYWSGAIRLMQDIRGGVSRTDKKFGFYIAHTGRASLEGLNERRWLISVCLSLFSAGQGDNIFCVPWDWSLGRGC
jgi:hypothetical protein